MAPAQQNKIVDSLIQGGERSRVGGVLCNDGSGLCLISKGALQGSDPGLYTNLVRLASQLSPQASEAGQGMTATSVPLITVESKSSSVLIKEYDGRTVAIQVPTTRKESLSNAESKEPVNDRKK